MNTPTYDQLITALRWLSEDANWNIDECLIKRQQNAGETNGIFMFSWGLRPWIFAAQTLKDMRFSKTYCSQCGAEFGPGSHGFSSCENHIKIACVPCRHEWYQGACVHCELLASEYRANLKKTSV